MKLTLSFFIRNVHTCLLQPIANGSIQNPSYRNFPEPRLALLDLNPTCLKVAARRLARYRPETYRGDVLRPLSIDGPGFNSVGISALLHCLPAPCGPRHSPWTTSRPC